MSSSRFLRVIAGSVVLCLALPLHGQGTGAVSPLERLGEDAYQRVKDASGVVLLSVNWNRKTKCSAFDGARLLSLSFDRGPDARGDGAPGDLVIDDPQPAARVASGPLAAG